MAKGPLTFYLICAATQSKITVSAEDVMKVMRIVKVSDCLRRNDDRWLSFSG